MGISGFRVWGIKTLNPKNPAVLITSVQSALHRPLQQVIALPAVGVAFFFRLCQIKGLARVWNSRDGGREVQNL